MELLENSVPQQRTRPINIKKEIVRYLRKWPYFLLGMILFYTGAKIYLRYSVPQYYSKTSLKLQETKGKTTALSDLKNLGMGVSGDNELQGETTVIISKPILAKVAESLHLEVSFFSMGTIKEVELYEDAPVTGKIIRLNQPDRFWGETLEIMPAGKNAFRLSGGKTVYPLNAPVMLSFGLVQISTRPGRQFSYPLKVQFRNLKSVVSGLESAINVSLPENKGLLMELSMVGPVPKKSEDILNELTRQYLIEGVNDKNEEAQNTQNFINDRLAIISEDLSGIEGEKERFKRSNQIVDLQTQATMALSKADENTKSIISNSMQLDLVNSLLDMTSGEQLIPTGMGLNSAAENNIAEYNALLLTRNRVLKQATYENPTVIEMNKQISVLRGLIKKNLMESRETLQLQIAQANAQLNMARGNISRYPSQEKIFRGIDRQQTLKEQLYLYLLQKREENAITLAVTAPKAKVVNPAFTTGIVKPLYRQIIYGSLAAGFLLPLLLFVGLNMMDTKVHTKQHILSVIPEAAVIAEIPVNKTEDAMVHPNDFSVFAESFRILGSNLKFMLKAKGVDRGGVILVTSSVKGEGKTTIAMNTALTLAGKSKVIIVGADIRNPQLHRFVEGKNVGLTDYLVSEDENPDRFVIRSGVQDNLDVLFSGQIAPNPNDLLDMKKFDDMIAHFKSRYDYIVIDSAPVMLVSDTLHLVENSDAVLYVVKSDFTEKEMIDFAAGFQKENMIGNMAFVLNSVKPENTRYGKKYGYGYYSYTHDERPQWWKKFI